MCQMKSNEKIGWRFQSKKRSGPDMCNQLLKNRVKMEFKIESV